MHLSNEQITQSIQRLGKLNPFFSSVFLAFKKNHLAIGKTEPINFKKVVDDLLQEYWLYYPLEPDAENRHIYTPFLTSNTTDRWNKGPFTDEESRVLARDIR
jgi:hypothetical protein